MAHKRVLENQLCGDAKIAAHVADTLALWRGLRNHHSRAEPKEVKNHVTAAVWGFVGGIIAWLATTFVGQPLVAFIGSRSEAARALAQFGYLDRYDPERDDPPPEIATDRRKILAEAGARLVAFAHANQFVIPIFRKLKLFPQQAGDSLILLSQMKPYGSYDNEYINDQVMHQLRLGQRFGQYRV
jgi:hypothetical protein